MSDQHWWDDVAADFEAWLETQPDEVREADLLEQIDAYAAAHS